MKCSVNSITQKTCFKNTLILSQIKIEYLEHTILSFNLYYLLKAYLVSPGYFGFSKPTNIKNSFPGFTIAHEDKHKSE